MTMDKAYFTNIRSQIICLLEKAKEEVDIAMAWFTSSELFDSILSCIKRGVKVRLVLLDDAINFMEYAPDFNEFIYAGGELKIAHRDIGFMHHKFCVIDNSCIISGSYNWTYYAETRNIENIIITDSQSVIEQYKGEFLRLVNQADPVKECPKYSWTDMENMQEVDFHEINFEVKEIAKARCLPIHEIKPVVSHVTVTERPLNAVSKYSIGLHGDNGSGILIQKNQSLPFISQSIEVLNNDVKMVCAIFKMNEDKEVPIVQEAVNDITLGKIDQEIRIQFTLHETGELIGTIRCVETGRVFDIRKNNLDLVDYAD